MSDDDQLLQGVFVQLRASFGAAIRVLYDSPGNLTLQVGAGDDGILGLWVKDRARPSFIVTHRKRVTARDGSHQVRDAVAEGVLIEGVEWIVRQLAKHGVVLPERS